MHLETEKSLKKSVFPLLADLHSEIKSEVKNLSKSASKDSKSVDKSRTATQAHIDLLRDCTNAFDTGEFKFDPAGDPYIVQRQLLHRLHKQISEENNNRDDLLAAQGTFQKFEMHVIQTIQRVIASFVQILTAQAEHTKMLYGDIAHVSQRMPLDLEWNGFVRRNNSILIDPSVPPRTMESISFPNRDHPATRAIIEGTLERKTGHLVKHNKTGYYVITPSKFLHELEDDDFSRKELTPELSLYLPDCTVGVVSGLHFTVKGKDASKGKIGSALTSAHELEFKARSEEEARKWWEVIRQMATADDSVPNLSPTTTGPMDNLADPASTGGAYPQAGGLGTGAQPAVGGRAPAAPAAYESTQPGQAVLGLDSNAAYPPPGHRPL